MTEPSPIHPEREGATVMVSVTVRSDITPDGVVQVVHETTETFSRDPISGGWYPVCRRIRDAYRDVTVGDEKFKV